MSDKPERRSKSEKRHAHKKRTPALDEEAAQEPVQEEPVQEEVAQDEPEQKNYTSEKSNEDDSEINGVNETTLLKEDVFESVAADTFSAFSKVFESASDHGVKFSKPEFVFIGKKKSGKTTLIESIIRMVRLLPSSNKRAFTIHLNKRDDNEITLRKDYSLKEFSEDIQLTPDQVENALSSRNSRVKRFDPSILHISSSDKYPVVYVDTAEDDIKSIEDILKQSNRYIIVVINSNNVSESSEYVKIARNCDPSGSRSLFVYTHFNEVAKSFQSSREAAQFFTAAEKNSYFITLPCTSLRFSDAKTSETIQLKLSRRDKSMLKEIQTDSKYTYRVGLPFFESALMQICWKHYQSQIPLGLQALRKQIISAKQQNDLMKSQLEKFNSANLRPLASEYTSEYLQFFDEVIKGSVNGDIETNGQTLEEEQERAGLSLLDNLDWATLQETISNADKKLYGGQQFLRLLDEFKIASENSPALDTSFLNASDDGSLVQNIPTKVWDAVELAKIHSQNVFLPLIERLVLRAAYIFNRIPNIVSTIMKIKKEQNILILDFPSFLEQLSDYSSSFVEKIVANTLTKCKEEFFSTKTLCWDLTENTDAINSSSNPGDWAQAAFERIRSRVIRNVLAKMYNFFLAPFEKELWSYIQSKVSCLSDAEISALLSLDETKRKLEESLATNDSNIKSLSSQEADYKKSAGSFAFHK